MRGILLLVCVAVGGAAAAAGHRDRAQIAESTGHTAQAATEYERAYAEENDPDLLYRLGLVRRKLKQYELAQEAFRGYLRNAPDGAFRDEVIRQLTELGVLLEEQHRQVPDDQRKKPRRQHRDVPVKGLTPPPATPAPPSQSATASAVPEASPGSAAGLDPPPPLSATALPADGPIAPTADRSETSPSRPEEISKLPSPPEQVATSARTEAVAAAGGSAPSGALPATAISAPPAAVPAARIAPEVSAPTAAVSAPAAAWPPAGIPTSALSGPAATLPTAATPAPAVATGTSTATQHAVSPRSRAAPWIVAGAAALAVGGAALWWDGDRTASDLDARYASGDLSAGDSGSYGRARRESIAGRAMVAGALVLGAVAVALWR